MPADVWEAQFEELSKNYHVFLLDPRSQGLSDMTPVGNNPLRRSQDIQELLDYLHLDSVVLVGWSLGAYDALAYLDQFGTDKLYALVLVDSPLAPPSGPAPTQRSPFLQRFINDREKENKSYVWSLFKKEQPLGFYKNLDLLVARIPTDIAVSTLDNTQPADSWQPSLKTLGQVPLLYAVTPKFAAQAVYLQQVDPQARVETFDHAGHALFVDEPEHFNAALTDFLRQASLYPVGMIRITERPKTAVSPASAAAAPLIAPTPLPTSLPPATFTPIPAAPSPTPVSVIISPSPTDTATSTATPEITSTPSPTAILTPSLTPVPKKFLSEPATATPTAVPPPASLGSRLSQTWNSFLGRTKPIPMEEASPAPRHSVLNLSAQYPIQDSFFTTSDHVKLHYLEAGQGLPIVLIPGWLLPAEIWKPQLEGLSPYYHIIALDPRSQGESDITAQGDEPVQQAKDIQELLDHLHLNSVVLVGWSHGGFQVLAYMNEFGTDRLYAAVLVDSVLAAASSPATVGPQARFLEQLKNDRPKAIRGFVWSLFKNPPPVDFMHDLVAAAIRTPADIALTLLNSPFPGNRWQPSQKVMFQVPLLYAVTPKYAYQANYLIQVDPQAHVELFNNSGHALFVDEADHFNAAMRDFLQKAALYPPGLPETQHKKAAHP
jgi:microsomal epoxide hydrolase